MGDHHHGPATGREHGGCLPPTTRTSERCTCGSLSPCSMLGGFFAMVIRAELFQPGMQLVEPAFFQPDDHPARASHGLWGHHAVLSLAWLTG